MRGIRVFLPQIVGAALTTVGATACGYFHGPALIPWVFLTGISGAASLIGAMAKLITIAFDGWDRVDPPRGCKRCRELETENARLLEAIKP